MVIDIHWLAQQSRELHHTFTMVFYALVTLFLIIGLCLEHFKLVTGDMPSFHQLVSRALIAALLLHSYTWVSNTTAEVSQTMASQVGDLNNFEVIRKSLAEKFKKMNMSWFAVKDSLIMVVSFVAFLLFHFAYYAAEGFLLYTWTLLYIFSPVLIALYVLPATASATGALYRSLFEVSCWKIVWSVLATLLWSVALGELNKPGNDINFLSVITYCLILAGSLLLTPLVVNALAGAGISTLSQNLGALGLGAAAMAPSSIIGVGASALKKTYNTGHRAATSGVSEKYFPRMHAAIDKLPRFNLKERPPIFEPRDRTAYSTQKDLYTGHETYFKDGKAISEEQYKNRRKGKA